ncbi:MAG: glycosyltransferase [Desulfuromonadales bacterium]|nr:glycosyltransferase [Desulfuromonadales bacterium]
MENNPLISVAIPAYNHGRFIRDCLVSVADQTYQNIELIVIDDGSKDDTADVIRSFIDEYEERFARVIFRSRSNRGVSATSNECLRLSQGQWVHLLGSDDLLAPDKVAIQWQMVQEWNTPDLGLIYSDAGFIDAEGQLLDRPVGSRPPPGPTKNGYRDLFLANRIPNPTVALRRDAFMAVGGFDESLFLEDWDCWLRLAAHYSIGRVPQVLAFYRYHAGNTHLRQAEMLEAMLISFGKFLNTEKDRLPAHVVSKNWRKNLHRLWRWARRSDPGSLPLLALSSLKGLAVLPDAEDYFRYAARIRRILDGKGEIRL